jgi:hypothetical protein
MIIDAWAQHPTARHRNHPMFDSLRRWTQGQAGSSPIAAGDDAEWPCRSRSTQWTRRRTRSLLQRMDRPRGDLISNDEVAAFVRAAPDRFVGVGSVDIARPREAVRELRRCVRELGFKAVRVLPWLWELPPTHPLFYPVFSECCELGVPFCTQVGHTGPLKPSEYGRPIPYIDHRNRFPGTRHRLRASVSWTEEMIAVATST